MDSLTPDDIIKFLEKNGPSTIVNMASNFKVQSYLIGANLSEMIRQKQILVTSKSMGSSALHYLPSQKDKIFRILHDKLNSKDKVNIDLLKEKKVLFREELTEFQDFSLGRIKDLAKKIEIPIGGENKQIWYFYDLSQKEIQDAIIERYKELFGSSNIKKIDDSDDNNKTNKSNANNNNYNNNKNNNDNENNSKTTKNNSSSISKKPDVEKINSEISNSNDVSENKGKNSDSSKNRVEGDINSNDDGSKVTKDSGDSSIFDSYIKGMEEKEKREEEKKDDFSKFDTQINHFDSYLKEKKATAFIRDKFSDLQKEFDCTDLKLISKKEIVLKASKKHENLDLSYLIVVYDGKRFNDSEYYKYLNRAQISHRIGIFITNAKKPKKFKASRVLNFFVLFEK